MSFEIVALGSVVSVDSRSVAPDAIIDGTNYVGLESIGRSGALDESITVRAGELKSNKFAFDARHVLFGKLRPNLGKIARPSGSGVCSTDIYPLLPSDRLDRGYLAHFLLRPKSIAKAASRTSGVNLPRIGAAVLKSFEIPLPCLSEQRRIAAILDQADELRAKSRRALTLLDELADSVFLEMFGDPVVNERRWPQSELSEILQAIDSGSSPVCRDRPRVNDEWAVLKLGSISSGTYRPDENKAILPSTMPLPRNEVRSGDLLLSRKNTLGLVGASVFIDEAPPRLLLPDLIFRLVPRSDAPVTARFLQRVLAHKSMRNRLRKLAGGSAASMVNISKERLRRVSVPVPGLQIQARFEQQQLEVRRNRNACDAQVRVLDELFASLQHRAFRGEL